MIGARVDVVQTLDSLQTPLDGAFTSASAPDEFMFWLQARRPSFRFSDPVLIVAAHPDDEIIGAGGQLRLMQNVIISHVTDGAPANLADAQRSGFTSREAYAQARREELGRALELVGCGAPRLVRLNMVDQTASLNLATLTRRVRELLLEFQPETILTHPYEGGHPDHDASAFAVHLARASLAKGRLKTPALIEFASYYNRGGSMGTGQFIPGSGSGEVSVALTVDEQQLKRAALGAFVTQRETLQYFRTDIERFRPAPRYDFSQPPHPGTLYYERFDWGMTGVRWRELACAATAKLEPLLPLCPCAS